MPTLIRPDNERWEKAHAYQKSCLDIAALVLNAASHTVPKNYPPTFCKRYLAKQFHPDYSLGEGIEKIIRNEMFKEIWNEVGRLDQGASAGFATARSSSAA